ncbi:hypothetical protein F4678DRAFT_484520 [Xylaria arbuscula]|nr:hypothetical protein F4678DRAFT_484520 [Xylaria arbuscula]
MCELAYISNNKEEFKAALQKRREERFQEIQANWEKTRRQLVANPIIWKEPPRGRDCPWATFCRLGRYFSFDTIMGHFGNYVVDDPRVFYNEESEKRKAQVRSGPSAATAAVEARSSSPTPSDQLGHARQATPGSPPSSCTSRCCYCTYSKHER